MLQVQGGPQRMLPWPYFLQAGSARALVAPLKLGSGGKDPASGLVLAGILYLLAALLKLPRWCSRGL